MFDKDDVVENVKKNIKAPKMDEIDILESLDGKKVCASCFTNFHCYS